jgi:hypothetical protein
LATLSEAQRAEFRSRADSDGSNKLVYKAKNTSGNTVYLTRVRIEGSVFHEAFELTPGTPTGYHRAGAAAADVSNIERWLDADLTEVTAGEWMTATDSFEGWDGRPVSDVTKIQFTGVRSLVRLHQVQAFSDFKGAMTSIPEVAKPPCTSYATNLTTV